MKTGARTPRGNCKDPQSALTHSPVRAQVLLLLETTTEVTPVPGIALLKNNRKHTAEKLQPLLTHAGTTPAWFPGMGNTKHVSSVIPILTPSKMVSL